ncbi:LAGLIDADG family homing endonuclease [Thermococcus sp. Bubb.Bath]|uniref:LAGLIDADG family homing endonuclease n=1 Tax=Thermococcus sp. Bubb.Bath TaxID=1638242 RepID=UPI001439AF49|nr:LAGLIDADG family homing endonuclease [Thermococcus sp. Bubb.Bath]NJF25928.1 DNA endonuclease [Thermococcus sp. Bubb.Bath]
MRTLRNLSQKELEEVQKLTLELREKGLSYSQIVRKISEELDVKVSKATVLRWCKGTHNTFNKMKRVNLDSSPALAYIIGVYFGDATATKGAEYKYNVKLKVVDKEFADAFAEALKDIGLKPRSGFENDRTRSGRWYVETSSKSLYLYLKGSKERLFEVATKYPREFLRGFFDSEGSAIITRNRIRVEACNYNKEVLEFCQELLNGLDIYSKIYRTKRKGQPVVIRGEQYHYTSDLFTLKIYRLESVYRYMREVGFTISRKQNKLINFFGLSQQKTQKLEENYTKSSI